MSDSKLRIRRVAVLGAGVMGAQIAAHLVNANVETVLFDLAAKEGDPNGIVTKAIANLGKLSPAPLATKAKAADLVAGNYDQNLAWLAGCDLIIEAIAERMDWKHDLYKKIAPHIAPHAIMASNTSGLSITALADGLPKEIHERFCGVHFFNPPRYMHLAELIPIAATRKDVLDGLEAFLVTTLGKGVVIAKDTPNFIGNRIGVFSMLSTMHHTEAFGLSYDLVDALTGPAIGRPKSATYRTADVVGLDTMAHVIKTMGDTLPNDPWKDYFKAPAVLGGLIAKGALGQKTGAGFFRKAGKDIVVLDPKKADYVPTTGAISAEVAELLKLKNPAERLAKLRASADPQAQFLWSIFRDLFHYTAFHLAEIADNARDVDFAIRWGYGWALGPFEIWQASGWKQVAGWINEDIAAGKTMAKAPLPAWVTDGRDGVHAPDGSFAPAIAGNRARSSNPVYKRQHFPDPTIGEKADRGTTLFETDAVRFWHPANGGDIGVLSFKTKMNTIGPGVIDGIHQAIDHAEKSLAGMVIWQTGEPFSAGADLSSATAALKEGRVKDFEASIDRFQQTSMRIRRSLVPVVAALRGMAFGGGCEFQMHAAKTVAALETYVGLVEAGVGLLPGGGGLKELALRAAQANPGDVFTGIKAVFETVAMAKVSASALEAKELGLLRPTDTVVFNSYELLHVAISEARALSEAGYRPPLPARAIPVAGDTGTATLKMMLVNMKEGGFISAHDYEVASRIATVLCGGEIERGSTVDEQWLLDREREHFVALALMPKTQERIMHTLTTGKPLRN